MADYKTTLRETSVAVNLHNLINTGNSLKNNIVPNEFYNLCTNVLNINDSHILNLQNLSKFDKDSEGIIKNGFKLGNEIYKKFSHSFGNKANITWSGGDTQKEEPYDLIVNQLNFSLKEESFILKNMGLYQLLNLLTNCEHKRGLHVFRKFGNKSFNNWFLFTWKHLMKYLETNNFYKNKYGTISFNDEKTKVEFTMKSKVIYLPINILSESDFNNKTNNKIREKLFSKYINEHLRGNNTYDNLKENCVKEAGDALVKYIQQHLNAPNIERFLQVYDEKYYYAKTTSNSISILEVPSSNDFNKTFEISNISWKGTTQLNLIIEVKNINTEQTIKFRNECRYSHGQLNGTPEAKLYYENGSDLSIIYNQV